MRNNNKSPKSGNDRAFGKEKFGQEGRPANRNFANEGRSFRKDSGDRPARSHGKPEYTKKGADDRAPKFTSDRGFSKDADRKPAYGKYTADKRTPFSNNDKGEKRPFKGEERRVWGKDERKAGARPSFNADKKFASNRPSFKREEENPNDFKLAYEPKFKKKDFADKNKRDYFERKSRAHDKSEKEDTTATNRRGAKPAKPVVNTRQHNPSGKLGSPRYNFDKDGPKPAKGVKPLKSASADKEEKTVRLNRYIANAGVCSRREADDLISSGQISVNGKVTTELGYQVKKSDTVKFGKRVLNPEKLIYVLMNKPKDYITTMDDPEDRKTVMDLLEGAFPERVYPVGRLDRNTTGLLLLTNDGELADKLTHPSYNTRKIYQAELDKPFTEESFLKLKEGVQLEDGFIKPDDLAIVTPDAYVVGIEIHSGKNRVVRRIFEHLGYDVKKLDRTVFANLNKRDLPRGKWRYLSEKEVVGLKFLS